MTITFSLWPLLFILAVAYLLGYHAYRLGQRGDWYLGRNPVREPRAGDRLRSGPELIHVEAIIYHEGTDTEWVHYFDEQTHEENACPLKTWQRTLKGATLLEPCVPHYWQGKDGDYIPRSFDKLNGKDLDR